MLKLRLLRLPGMAPVVFAALLAGGLLARCPAAAQETPADAPKAPSDDRKSPAKGGRMEPLPPELQGVGLTQKLGASLPLQAEFKDEYGKKVRLKDYFDGKRPVLLTLNYFR